MLVGAFVQRLRELAWIEVTSALLQCRVQNFEAS
jgi:hypothetical protein